MEYLLTVTATAKDEFGSGPGRLPLHAEEIATELSDELADFTRRDYQLPWRVTSVTAGYCEPAAAVSSFTGEHSFLSNFWACHVPYAGYGYPSAEHAYQAAKTVLPAERRRIAACETPGAAKRAGRSLALRPDWEQLKKRVMLAVVLSKFQENPELAEQLAATGDAPLAEGNHWHDNFWGDCRCGRQACREPGLNALGRCLETVRFLLGP